jgi:very-short-patch-repair endonuclease
MRSGIRSARLAQAVPFDVIDGLRMATPIELLLACARDLCLVDLVVLLDGAAFLGEVDLELLGVVVASLGRRRGLVRLRQAVALADPRSESPWETLLRLLLIACGVQVEPQYDVPGQYGPLARADLWVVGTRTLLEFDGEVHLARAQQKRDLRRCRRLDGEHWTRHGYTADDVLHRSVTVLRDADVAVAREHRPERIRAWHDMIRQSLFTAAGQAALARRIEPKRPA